MTQSEWVTQATGSRANGLLKLQEVNRYVYVNEKKKKIVISIFCARLVAEFKHGNLGVECIIGHGTTTQRHPVKSVHNHYNDQEQTSQRVHFSQSREVLLTCLTNHRVMTHDMNV